MLFTSSNKTHSILTLLLYNYICEIPSTFQMKNYIHFCYPNEHGSVVLEASRVVNVLKCVNLMKQITNYDDNSKVLLSDIQLNFQFISNNELWKMAKWTTENNNLTVTSEHFNRFSLPFYLGVNSFFFLFPSREPKRRISGLHPSLSFSLSLLVSQWNWKAYQQHDQRVLFTVKMGNFHFCSNVKLCISF